MAEVYSSEELQDLVSQCLYKNVFNILYRSYYSDLPDSLVVLYDLKFQILWKALRSNSLSPCQYKHLTKEKSSSPPCQTLASLLFKLLKDL